MQHQLHTLLKKPVTSWIPGQVLHQYNHIFLMWLISSMQYERTTQNQKGKLLITWIFKGNTGLLSSHQANKQFNREEKSYLSFLVICPFTLTHKHWTCLLSTPRQSLIHSKCCLTEGNSTPVPAWAVPPKHCVAPHDDIPVTGAIPPHL